MDQIPVIAPPVTLPVRAAVVLPQIEKSAPALTTILAANSEKKPYRQPVAAAPFIKPIPKTSVEFVSFIATPTGTSAAVNVLP